jgi:hypothetical protein
VSIDTTSSAVFGMFSEAMEYSYVKKFLIDHIVESKCEHCNKVLQMAMSNIPPDVQKQINEAREKLLKLEEQQKEVEEWKKQHFSTN